jgi:hypothetical protein
MTGPGGSSASTARTAGRPHRAEQLPDDAVGELRLDRGRVRPQQDGFIRHLVREGVQERCPACADRARHQDEPALAAARGGEGRPQYRQLGLTIHQCRVHGVRGPETRLRQ